MKSCQKPTLLQPDLWAHPLPFSKHPDRPVSTCDTNLAPGSLSQPHFKVSVQPLPVKCIVFAQSEGVSGVTGKQEFDEISEGCVWLPQKARQSLVVSSGLAACTSGVCLTDRWPL